MMAQKHLHELLKEDQEPFLLKKYISDRRSQLERPSPKSSMQVKRRRPMHQNLNFPANFCKHACFFSFTDTPDARKSPLFQLPSPAKSPSASANPIFLHIPARTAALLLEAALRIHKQSSASPKTKAQHKSNAFGLFGSFFKRLTQRNRNRKREIDDRGAEAPVKEILRWDSSTGRGELLNGFSEKTDSQKDNNISDFSACEVEFLCSCNGRPSSAVWSESNEDKSLGMETSISSQCDEFEEFDFLSKRNNITECACCDNNALCQSPFGFVLHRSASSASGTPELASPASSPSCRTTQDKENNGAERVDQCQSGEETEEKEQCSPVSIFDPPFEDDDEGHENNEEGEEEEDGFDLENSYAIVQRAKEQLLQKLRRFEKLAELDPVELEKRLFDQEEEEEDDNDDDEETFLEECEWEDDNEEASDKENGCNELVLDVLRESSLRGRGEIRADLKRLIGDLLTEERERGEGDEEERERVIKRVCKRLELWRGVEANTIDMMVEQDLSREDGGWKENGQHMREMAGELEHVIFGFLVQEMSEELAC
ncbi:uncharacterized protein LOC114746528 [Neltuma alba]|uniref:uncharacterized protein LOC114745933 n=1 Tax=Neltuma alba TaxID=207710 RepID=UPI0010A3ADAE|nr:uncharacterized protein LOC114745933 [Prosopis alba]XP_028790579.1 uncharacterized protein LOC114746528 [Prosopis alba]